MAMVAERLLDSNTASLEGSSGGLSEEQRASLAHNLSDVIGLLPKLCTGIDVNLRFHDIAGFEYTQETVSMRRWGPAASALPAPPGGWAGGALPGKSSGCLAGRLVRCSVHSKLPGSRVTRTSGLLGIPLSAAPVPSPTFRTRFRPARVTCASRLCFHAYAHACAQAVFDLLDIPLVHGWLVDPQVGVWCSAAACACAQTPVPAIGQPACHLSRASRSSPVQHCLDGIVPRRCTVVHPHPRPQPLPGCKHCQQPWSHAALSRTRLARRTSPRPGP